MKGYAGYIKFTYVMQFFSWVLIMIAIWALDENLNLHRYLSACCNVIVIVANGFLIHFQWRFRYRLKKEQQQLKETRDAHNRNLSW